MNILSIDTTTKKANVGVCINNKFTIKSLDNEITHSEKLLPLIDDVLTETNATIKDIDLISCTTGPGSFTGIRIGLATVKAIAKVINCNIFSMNSLELLANTAKPCDKYKVIIPLIDAKNKRAYYGMYKNGKQMQQINELGNKYIQDILEEVTSYCNSNNLTIQNDVLFVLDNENIASILCTDNNYNYKISTIDLKLLMELANNSNTFSNYLELDATYVRNSEAERTKYGE